MNNSITHSLWAILLEQALTELNKQHIKLYLTEAEGERDGNMVLTRWVKAAMKAIESRRQALLCFDGMSDAQVAQLDVVQELISPLDLEEADDAEMDMYTHEYGSEPGCLPEDAEATTHGHSEAASVVNPMPSNIKAPALANSTPAVRDTSNATTIGASASAHTAIDTSDESIASRSTRKSRPSKHESTWAGDYAGVEFLVTSPTIVKLKDGSFVELRCDACGGNSSWAHHIFNKGVRGFQSHFRQVHNENPKPRDVLQRCTHRVATAQEVEQIIRGDSTVDIVPCRTKVDIGSGVEYVGNRPDHAPHKPRSSGHTVESLAAAAATDSSAAKPVTAPKKRKRVESDQKNKDIPTRPKRDVSAPSLEKCLVVVKTTTRNGEDAYHELRCDICHGNGSFGSGKFLHGIKGFKMHLNQIHDDKKVTTADILRRCSHRQVPLDEVRQIQAGNVNIGFIRCDGSSNVRPKNSHKDFNNTERA